jgi:hypothetical protein
MHYSASMHWEVLFHEEFDEWFGTLEADEQDSILTDLGVLAEIGPTLGRPRVDTLKGTTLKNLKELRVRHTGIPIRVLFAFDPWQKAIVLVGGNKAGDNKWYRKHIPIAESRYKDHIEKTKRKQANEKSK